MKDKILRDHIGLIRTIAAGFQGDQDEMTQLGLIAVSNALDRFDEKRGKITTFIGTVVKNRLINYVNREQSLIKTPRNKTKYSQVEALNISSDDFVLGKIEDALVLLTYKERIHIEKYLKNPTKSTGKQMKVLRKFKCILTGQLKDC